MNYGYPYPTYPQMSQPQLQPRTNKIFVTSLEDALNRPADPNSEVIYLDQDKPFLYQVMNDMQGRKTYKTFELTEYSGVVSAQNGSADYVTREEFNRLVDEMKALKSDKGVLE